ncbi:unnamed protein product [Brassica napus]|uniref:(rape) hypothetical protein n=2 Tax=Brassica napus TaxID=3708 RepID=A0A816YS68_BRANA|nr:unnamed protein product [Brassica napus]
MTFPSTGLAVLPLCDGEAPDPPPPPRSIAPPPSVTKTHDSSTAAVHYSSYTWIPSACERCGALGHKEKRCLLPPTPHDSAPVTKESQVAKEDIPIVDIVHLMQNSSITHVEHVEPNSRSHTTHQSLETSKKSVVTLPSEDASAGPITHSHEVHSSSCSQFDNNLPLLAVEKAAPTQSLNIMEDIPSHSIFLEDHRASETEQQIDLRSPLTLDHQPFSMEPETPLAYGKGIGFDVVGDSSSYTVTRGGRAIKLTQKVQEMGWMNISGRKNAVTNTARSHLLCCLIAIMIMSEENRRAISKYLFQEGVLFAKKDFNLAQHPLVEGVPNLQVIKLMQSFKSKEYVRETFAWMHYYWFLTNEGIDFLRTYLNLPSEIVPATLKKQQKPLGRPMGDRPRGPPRSDGERRSGDRDGYRGGQRSGGEFGDKSGAPADYQPSFRGSGAGSRPGFGRGAGGYGAGPGPAAAGSDLP